MRTTIFDPNNLQIELAVNKERLRVTEDRLHVTEDGLCSRDEKIEQLHQLLEQARADRDNWRLQFEVTAKDLKHAQDLLENEKQMHVSRSKKAHWLAGATNCIFLIESVLSNIGANLLFSTPPNPPTCIYDVRHFCRTLYYRNYYDDNYDKRRLISLKRFHLPLTFFPATISIVAGIVAAIIRTSSKSTSLPTFPTATEVLIFTTTMILISALCLIFDFIKRPSSNIQEKEDISLTEVLWEKEIKSELNRASSEVKKARSIVKKYRELEAIKDASIDIDEIIDTAYTTSQTALLLLYAKVEEQIIVLLQEAQSQTNHVLSHEAIDEAAKKGLIPPEIVAASHDFVSIRNDIAHDSGFEFDDALFSSIATGIKLLKIISAKDLSV